VGVALGDLLLAGVGQPERLAPVDLLRAHEALVLQLLERGVDRAGAGAPNAFAALLDLLHDLVAVARLLGEQQQRRGTNVPAPRLAPATPRRAGAEAAAEREVAQAAARSMSHVSVGMTTVHISSSYR